MVNREIFLGSGASTTLIPEQDIYIPINGTGGSLTTTKLIPTTAFTTTFKFVPNIYIGSSVDVFDANDNLLSSHTVASNTPTGLVLATAVGAGTPDYAYLRAYGSPSPHPEVSSKHALLADNWLGLMESVTFPNLSQEIKQMNMGIGGTRNFSFQYKGIRTADNGSLALVANTGSWLYYALGACSAITYTAGSIGGLALQDIGGSSVGTDQVPLEVTASTPADAENALIIEGAGGSANTTTTGPHFYRTVYGGRTIVPPIDFEIFNTGAFQHLSIAADGRPENLTYTFAELNTDQLPSFSLEQSVSKDPAVLNTNADFTDATADDESQSFTRIARGCRVNSLTIEAAEGEELKMNLDINSRLVDSITDIYRSTNTTQSCTTASNTTLTVADSSLLSLGMIVSGVGIAANTTITAIASATSVTLSQAATDSATKVLTFTNNPKYIARAGQNLNERLFNWNAGTDHASPFFFSQGTFSAFGQQFLKVNSVSIAITNNLLDKRYMGGHRDMKEGIPAQRTYEITFEAVVTDDLLFREMLNETENTSANHVSFSFTKPDTNESITLSFKDYFLDTTEITIPDDKGPVTFSSTIKPRNLASCVVVTDNVLMG